MAMRMRWAVVFALAFGLAGAAAFGAAFPNPPKEPAAGGSATQFAVLAGGCFWGMEGVFERLKGVKDVVAGYSGGEADTAHYGMVSTGSTGHAESIRIDYDPKAISYGTLLEVFFSVAHDPTQLDYQGPDEGTQYRSAIFYANDAQKRVAEQYIRALDAAHVYGDPIVTRIAPFKAFYPAEDEHQHFMDNNPYYPYILMWDLPKVRNLEKEYPELVAKK